VDQAGQHTCVVAVGTPYGLSRSELQAMYQKFEAEIETNNESRTSFGTSRARLADDHPRSRRSRRWRPRCSCDPLIRKRKLASYVGIFRVNIPVRTASGLVG